MVTAINNIHFMLISKNKSFNRLLIISWQLFTKQSKAQEEPEALLCCLI